MAHLSSTQVALCENNIWSQAQYDRALAHELVHAYDYCRSFFNYNSLLHHACTEVRLPALQPGG